MRSTASKTASRCRALLNEVVGQPEQEAVHYAVLRSLPRAVYGPTEDGHFALATDCYCHFTSPIRRYPDLTIHRLLDAMLAGQPPRNDFGALATLGEHCSERERRAEAAERELTKVKLLSYLSDRIGLELDAVITGVESFGVFARGLELPAEGLIHVSSLQNDFYDFDRGSHTLCGRRTGDRFRLGDRIRVQVARIDLENRELDFRLLAKAPAKGAAKPAEKKKPRKKQAQSASAEESNRRASQASLTANRAARRSRVVSRSAVFAMRDIMRRDPSISRVRALPAVRAVYIFAFASGACALVYEVAWVRALGVDFGATVYAMSTVLSVFMGGLAIGARLFGRWADRTGNPLRLYGCVELLLGLYAAILVAALPQMHALSAWLLRDSAFSHLQAGLFKFLLASAALAPLTVLIGGTFPVMSKLVAESSATLGRRLATLYGVNTLGAVLGCLGEAFFLIIALGVKGSILLAAGVNGAIGLTAIALSTRGFAPAAPAANAAEDLFAGELPPRTGWGQTIAFGSGFGAMAAQVLWTRLFINLLSGAGAGLRHRVGGVSHRHRAGQLVDRPLHRPLAAF